MNGLNCSPRKRIRTRLHLLLDLLPRLDCSPLLLYALENGKVRLGPRLFQNNLFSSYDKDCPSIKFLPN